MNKSFKYLVFLGLITLNACQSCIAIKIEPNHEGVKMVNYGRNGIEDFQIVVGTQYLATGERVYQVPMYDEKAEPIVMEIRSNNGGVFKIDPTLTYHCSRGKGPEICFNYKHTGIDDKQNILNNIELIVINPLILDVYRNVARNFSNDSILNNMGKFERVVEEKLANKLKEKGFDLVELTSGLTPPESSRVAIEKKNNVNQMVEQVRNEVEIAKMEQEKAKIEAETRKIEASGITEQFLKLRYIESLEKGNKVIITDGKFPIFLQDK